MQSDFVVTILLFSKMEAKPWLFIVCIFILPAFPPGRCQTAKEMRDAMMKSDIKLWPDLSCLPNGPLKGYKKFINENKSPAENLLKTVGLEGLYKFHKLTTECDELVNNNKKVEGDLSKLRCRKMCILEKLQVLKSPWHLKNITLGDIPYAVSVVKGFLTGPGSGANFTMDLELTAEVAVRLLYNELQLNMETNPDPIRMACFKNPDESGVLRKFIDSSADDILKAPCKKEPKNFYFPSTEQLFSSPRPFNTIPKTFTKYWPDLTCMKNWMKDGQEKVLEKAYQYGEACRRLFNNTQFRNMHGGDAAYDRCTKVCVLNGMGIVEPMKLMDWPLQNLFGVQYQINSKSDGGGFHQALNGLMDVEINSKDDFYAFARKGFSSLKEKVKQIEAPCFSEEWKPVIQETEKFFKNQCNPTSQSDSSQMGRSVLTAKGEKPSENSGRTIAAKEGKVDEIPRSLEWPMPGTRFWPDFSCIKGWYDVDNRDITHHLANSKGSGAKLMKKVTEICSKEFSDFSEEAILRCTRRCILDKLSLVKNSEANNLTDVDTFYDGLSMILTDKGGFSSVAELGLVLYKKLSQSDVWKSSKGATCDDPRFDFLTEVIDNVLIEFSDQTCLQLRPNPNEPNWKEEYLNSDHVKLTANLDLSCYPAFDYKGIESGEGDMLPFLEIGNDCSDILMRKGIAKGHCEEACVFQKMGLFNWNYTDGKANPSMMTKDNMASKLSRFFSGNGANSTVGDIAGKIVENCGEIHRGFKNNKLTCAQISPILDCVEESVSCNYTGKYLDEYLLSMDDPSKTYKYPDLSCREGFAHSNDHRQGSALIDKYRGICGLLTKEKYYYKEDRCILEQMGIIVANSSWLDGSEYKTEFVVNDEQEMALSLNKILPGFGGFDTATKLADIITGKCGSYLIGTGKKVDTIWGSFMTCVNIAMDCEPAAMFLTASRNL